jgi:pimeloyl-ACP methyl ester carboxylesterase
VFIDIDGNRLFALDFGSGPMTFLAHGGWISNFEDWIATLAPMSARWRTAVYDHRGAGESAVPPECITAEALVDDVFRVMDAMHIDRCVLGGFSRGTATVLRAAVRHPDRFDGLVLLNGHGDVREPSLPHRPRVPPSTWPGGTHAERLRWFIERCTPEPDVDHIRRWGVHILSRADEGVVDRLMMVEPEGPLDWALAISKLTLPVLIIHGELDPFVQRANVEYLHSLLVDGRLVVMEGSGHLPAMIRPLDVAREIDLFFSRGEGRLAQ